jgi:hypothetical protein
MTRYAIDPPALLELVRRGLATSHQLVAPAALRSQAMSLVYRGVRAGTVDASDVRELLDGITTTKVRLLGDRVSRGTAWRLATELGLEDTGDAEYLAVSRLQADALIALDPRIAELAVGVVPTASLDDLLREPG